MVWHSGPYQVDAQANTATHQRLSWAGADTRIQSTQIGIIPSVGVPMIGDYSGGSLFANLVSYQALEQALIAVGHIPDREFFRPLQALSNKLTLAFRITQDSGDARRQGPGTA